MVDPAGIPQFTGNLEQLAKDASGLRSAATGIRSGGADVHSRFQMLGAYYIAPEAEDLFSTTEPVMDKADTFAADLETVADALDTFASEVRPLAAKLVSLQEDARKFVASVEGDDDWTDDGDKTARNNGLVADVTATRAAFEAAERRAASKISALVGGPRFIEDDGSHKATEQTVMYGYDADLLKQAKDLPWGSPVSQTRPDNLGGHLTSFFYDGFVMNGAVASVKGLGTLVGIGGSAKDAWKGLYDVSAGAGHYLMKPTDWVLDQTMFATEDTADMKRQKTAFREFGKAFVAWDQWEEHPVQAAGTVTFNALTLAAGPLGAVAKGGSAAGKVGLGAKAVGIGAKIGTYADPFSAALTVGGKAVGKVPTIAELTSRLTTKAETTPEIQGVHSVLEVGGHKVLVKDGQFLPLNAEGKPVKDTAPSETTIARGEAPESPVLVGAGSRVPGVAAQADGHIPPQAGHEPTADRTGAGSTRSSGGAGSGKEAAAHHSGDNSSPQSDHQPAGDGGSPPGRGGHTPGNAGGAAADGSPGRGSTGMSAVGGGSHSPMGDSSYAGDAVRHGDESPAPERSDIEVRHNEMGDGAPHGRAGDQTTPPPGPGEKVLGHLDDSQVTRADELITHVSGRPVVEYLDDIARHRGAAYRAAKEAKIFPRKQVGACVGAVLDLRTGMIVEGINGKADAVIPLDKLHPTLAERYASVGTPPPHNDHPLGHAEVKAANELLWERTKRGLPDGESSLAEMRASVEFPFLTDKTTGTLGRPAPFCANCNLMLKGLKSSHGRFTGYPPSDENWTP